MSTTTDGKLVRLLPHEEDAMYQMVLYLRATADTLNDDRVAPKMRAWSNIVEQFLDRK